MNILMMTNAFWPHIGGVAKSVRLFMDEYLRLGHNVLTVAPAYPGLPDREENIVRVPAIVNVNGSDFAMTLAFVGRLTSDIERFGPDVVHTHHPFLIGSTAARTAIKFNVPLVFTYHTMYEQYLHYVPVDLMAMREFVIRLSSGYADLCDAVIAPSSSIAEILTARGVASPISVIPTGLERDVFCPGDGTAFRKSCGIPRDAFVAGHLGRLGPEKNVALLADAMADFCSADTGTYSLIVGSGPSSDDVAEIFAQKANGRCCFAGAMTGTDVVNAYRAMDVFVFTSLTETQGLVLLEAMACGVPVVAVDAPGVREILRDGCNGLLLKRPDKAEIVAALRSMREMDAQSMGQMRRNAVETAQTYGIESSARASLELYRKCIEGEKRNRESGVWRHTAEQIKTEWELISNFASAAALAIRKE